MKITIADLSNPQVVDMIKVHLAGMHANSPAGHVFALDSTGLSGDDITLFGAWDAGQLLGIGALKCLDGQSGEIKSMRTRADALRRGVGAGILEKIIEEAGTRNYSRLSLETGSGDSFNAAIGLYLKRGFVKGAAFGDYIESDFNQFFHLEIS